MPLRGPRSRPAALVGLLLLPLLGGACGPQRLEKTELDLRSAIAAAEGRGDTATLRLFLEVPFAFDSVYIVRPYMPADSLAMRMGAGWMPELTGRMYGPESAVFRVRRAPGAAAPSLLPLEG
jgi:hypothetical protein